MPFPQEQLEIPMLIFPELRKSKSAPTVVGWRSSPEALRHPNLHCQGMSSWGGVSRGCSCAGSSLAGCASSNSPLPAARPTHPPPPAPHKRHCVMNDLKREMKSCKIYSGIRRHKKGKLCIFVILYYFRKNTHTQPQNSCQWEETCVGCLCLSLSRAASFRFSASHNSLIYGWTQAGSERITSLALSHSCGKGETCEPFPLLFIIICIVSIFILLLIYLAVWGRVKHTDFRVRQPEPGPQYRHMHYL